MNAGFILRPARPAALIDKASATSSLIAGPLVRNDTFRVIRSEAKHLLRRARSLTAFRIEPQAERVIA
jgi:hypothetical protein